MLSDNKTSYWTVRGSKGTRRLVESQGHKLEAEYSILNGSDGGVTLLNPQGGEVDKTTTFLSRGLALLRAKRRVRHDGTGGYLFAATLRRRGK
jgi:hypothetical protein